MVYGDITQGVGCRVVFKISVPARYKFQRRFSMSSEPIPLNVPALIRTVRGERVILDSDLARIYGVSTTRFNEAVKRNTRRFPSDFRLRLTREEFEVLISQNATSKPVRGGRRVLPWAFTEHGAIMAANILNSEKATQMSVLVIRAFVKMRATFSETAELSRKLASLESEIRSRLNSQERAIVDILQQLMQILNPSPCEPSGEPPPREIGFHVKSDASENRVTE